MVTKIDKKELSKEELNEIKGTETVVQENADSIVVEGSHNKGEQLDKLNE